jgi:hypothetical protein
MILKYEINEGAAFKEEVSKQEFIWSKSLLKLNSIFNNWMLIC